MSERFFASGLTVVHEARVGLARWLLPLPMWAMPLSALLAWTEGTYAAVGAGFLVLLQLGLFGLLALPIPPLVAWLLRTDWMGGFDVEIDRKRLEVARTYRCEVRDIGIARISSPHVVELSTPARELRIRFAFAEDARSFASAVARNARQRRAYEVALRDDAGRLRRTAILWTTGLGAASIVLLASPPAWPLAPIAIALTGAAAWRERRLFVGADGIELRGWRRRFVAYRDVERVELLPTMFFGASTRVRLVLKDGKRLSLGRMERGRAQLVAALLAEGVRMVEEGNAAGARVAMLERDASEDEGAWQERVSILTRRGESYREHAVDAERLALLMRNPATDSEQRIAAALALRADPSALAKIRVAAEVSAEPRVSRLLAAVSDASLAGEELEHVLRRTR